jgi:oligopeptide transport system ATP-binding protein
MSLLEARSLGKSFAARRGLFRRAATVPAVVDVTFDVQEGETLALVGESGAGKSTVGRLVTRLIEPDSGGVVFDGVDLLALGRVELRAIRRRLQMIFQDPYSSLDPRATVGESVSEPLKVHDGIDRSERLDQAAQWLDRVGLGRRYIHRYPGELSGGQLQRACIARALTLHPKLIVCDEPTAALDVSIQAQVLNLMTDLQEDLGLAYLFISHDLALVQAISHRVAVMANCQIVEIGTAEQIYDEPQSDYTRRLLASIPVPVPKALRVDAASNVP